MDTSNTTEEEVEKIDGIYKKSLMRIDELSEKALALVKNIRLKREQKKIEDLRQELKNN
jgi:3-phosphoglycerate kinase